MRAIQEQSREEQLKKLEAEQSASAPAIHALTLSPIATAADAQRRDEELVLANKALQDV